MVLERTLIVTLAHTHRLHVVLKLALQQRERLMQGPGANHAAAGHSEGVSMLSIINNILHTFILVQRTAIEGAQPTARHDTQMPAVAKSISRAPKSLHLILHYT